MVKALLAILALTGMVAVTGCGSIPADIKNGGDQFIREWNEDKRPTIPDDEFNKLPVDKQALFMPQTLEDARVWGHTQWFRRTGGK